MMMPSRISRSVMMAGNVGGDPKAQRTQHLGYQAPARIFAPGVVVISWRRDSIFPSAAAAWSPAASASYWCAARRGATAGVSTWPDRTPFSPSRGSSRLLDVVIAVQTVSTIGAQRLKQAVAALPCAKRGRIYPA